MKTQHLGPRYSNALRHVCQGLCLLVGLALIAALLFASQPLTDRVVGRFSYASAYAPPVHSAHTAGPITARAFQSLGFVANTGQHNPAVRFYTEEGGHTLFFTAGEVIFQTAQFGENRKKAASVVHLRFSGANPHPPVVGLDLIYRGTERPLKSEFVVAPGADPSVIRLAYSGMKTLTVRADGALMIETAGGVLIEGAPVVYQDIAGRRVAVDGQYLLLSAGQVAFVLGAYDAAYPLVIDPPMLFSTYLGGSGADVVTGMALGDDAVCVTGSTGSMDFPTHEAVQQTFDGPALAGLQVTSTFMTCFAARNEASVLARMAVSPDSVGLIAQQTQPFTVDGFDQLDQPLAVAPTWRATGGTIDSTGLYTAGDGAGLYTVTATDPATGVEASATVNIFSGVATEEETGLPQAFALYSNYPNPFNPQTTIRFDGKAPARVVLTLYDVLGREQATLLEKDHAPGRYEVVFDARGWPSEIYFYVIEMGDPGSGPGQVFRAVKKMLLVR